MLNVKPLQNYVLLDSLSSNGRLKNLGFEKLKLRLGVTLRPWIYFNIFTRNYPTSSDPKLLGKTIKYYCIY